MYSRVHEVPLQPCDIWLLFWWITKETEQLLYSKDWPWISLSFGKNVNSWVKNSTLLLCGVSKHFYFLQCCKSSHTLHQLLQLVLITTKNHITSGYSACQTWFDLLKSISKHVSLIFVKNFKLILKFLYNVYSKDLCRSNGMVILTKSFWLICHVL